MKSNLISSKPLFAITKYCKSKLSKSLLLLCFTCFFCNRIFAEKIASQQNLFVDVAVKNQKAFKEINSSNQVFQLITHGRSGELFINGKWMNAVEIKNFLVPLLKNKIRHINIYGCEFAKGIKGIEAVEYLQKALGVSISASTNITGKNGDWILEVGKTISTINIYNYNYNLQCANWGTAPSQDFDCDGIINSIDIDDDNDGILDKVECALCSLDTFVNGNFESPVIPATSWKLIKQRNMPGWQTTATDTFIEVWSTGFNGVYSASGNQFAELNATQASTLYQTFCLNGASGIVFWSLKHRGRLGRDVASFKVGSSLNTLTSVAMLSDSNNAWGSYSGNYTIPAGMTNIIIAFAAISSKGPDLSYGNLIDDVHINITQNCPDTDGDGYTNNFDLDSDGDRCTDVYEASVNRVSGITIINGNVINGNPNTSITGLSVVAGPYCGNGFANSVKSATDSSSYNSAYTYSDATNSTIFSICPVLLPIDLVSFDVVKDDNNSTAYLQWVTMSEKNNKVVEIERSIDNNHWTKIGEVVSQGNSDAAISYQFEDKNPFQSLDYYRLKQIDFDGQFVYSKIVGITFTGKESINVFPNPAIDNLNVEIDGGENNLVHLTLFDLMGRAIKELTQTIQNKETIKMPINDLLNGIYTLQISTSNGTVSRKVSIGNHSSISANDDSDDIN